MIPYGRQEITEDDVAEVEKVLRSDFLTQGPTVPKFEKNISDYCGSSNAVAVNSATSALHIACLALGLDKGDYLWTSPNTFVASANCARYCGAEVDFVDINPNTYNISVDALSEKLKKAEQDGKLPKIVVPVHFAGQPCEMPAIHKLSKKNKVPIIYIFSERLSWGRGFNIHVGLVDQLFYDLDEVKAAGLLNKTLEGLVMRNITQYQWSYERFRNRSGVKESIYN